MPLKPQLRKLLKLQMRFKEDIEAMGRNTISYLKEHGGVGVILARSSVPYKSGGEPWNTGAYKRLRSCSIHRGFHMQDGVRTKGKAKIDVVDQWVYHSRLYRAAITAAMHPDFENIELIQLNSFWLRS